MGRIMDKYLIEKLKAIQGIVRSLESAALLFSAGVDSSLLLSLVREALGDKCLAITIDSPFISRQEIEQAALLANQMAAHHLIMPLDLLKEPGLSANPAERCYLCKRKMFSVAKQIAAQRGLAWVVDGTNAQDLEQHRPGLRASEELGIRSPLREAGLRKDEVRALAQELGLSNWNKPADSCLATRFPQGEPLNREKLSLIDRGERFLKELGLSCFRLRYHSQNQGQSKTLRQMAAWNQLARVQPSAADRKRILGLGLWPKIASGLKELGFETAILDLEDYCP